MKKDTKDFSKVFTEIDEILAYLPEQLLSKIPQKIKKEVKENKDKEYDFKYDESKKLVEQDIYNQTKDFLSIIYIVYICNKTEKTKLLEAYKETNEEIEKQKKLKYQREKLFQKEVNKENDEEETALVEGHESFWTIFINKIKNFFKKS